MRRNRVSSGRTVPLDPRSSILEQLTVLEPGHRSPARREPGFFRPFLWFFPEIAKKPQKPVTESGANFQQKIANWRKSASFAKIFLGSRTGSRPLLNEIRRTDRRIGPRAARPQLDIDLLRAGLYVLFVQVVRKSEQIAYRSAQIAQGPRPIGSDRWPSILGSAPAIRRSHTRPAGCKGHVSDK